MLVRYTGIASKVRRQGMVASADTCANVTSNQWVSHKLNVNAYSLTVGDWALIGEHAPEQWQRDSARQMIHLSN